MPNIYVHVLSHLYILHIPLTLSVQNIKKVDLAKNIGSDEAADNEPLHLDLYRFSSNL